MYNAFWRLALFVRGQSFSVKTFDRSRNGCQVIREGAGNDFRGPSVQALPLPSRVSPSRAPVFSCAHYFQAPATQAKSKWTTRGPKYSGQTKPKWSIWFDVLTKISRILGWMESALSVKFAMFANHIKPEAGNGLVLSMKGWRGTVECQDQKMEYTSLLLS